MSTASSILGIVPGLQATALVGHNLGAVKKSFDMKNSKQMMLKPIVKTGVTTLIGVGLITPTAQMISAL